MQIIAAKSTKNVIHKGRDGKVYQLDCIRNQVEIEKRLIDGGFDVQYVDSKDREGEAVNLVNSVHKRGYLNIFIPKDNERVYLSNGLMLQDTLYQLALEHALIAKEVVDNAKNGQSSFSAIGGGHHCEYDRPLGFGMVNTMAISAVYATSIGERVALLDLDTHHSNGCNELLRQKENVLMCSLWNQVIPVWKYQESQDNLLHEKVSGVDDYFKKLQNILKNIKQFKPSLFIYHLGFDVLDTDRLGGILGMNEDKLLQREEIVKSFLNSLQIPFIIYRGGGYVKYGANAQENTDRQEKLLKTQMAALDIHF